MSEPPGSFLFKKSVHFILTCFQLGERESMARYRGPKNRIARRFAANIFGKARNPMLHKQNPAGMHGAKRKKKSEYGLQLEERQKLKAAYGMLSYKQLVN